MMKTFLAILLLLGSLVLSPPHLWANDLDQLLGTLIIGTWEEGTTPYGIVIFSDDGTFQAKMFKSKQKKEQLLEFKGTWRIEDSELQSVLTESSSPQAPVGEALTDTIVQINRTELMLIGINGRRYSKFRVFPEITE